MRLRFLLIPLVLVMAAEVLQSAELYDETYRPQFHFSAKQGWLNDPNGLVYHDGQYHLFYQHNPFGNNWGNMSWGHATSPDLIHWSERSPAIVGDTTGVKFSGTAVIDHNNTAGLQTGDTPTMALFYTSVGSFDQRMAYSTDGGRNFQYYAGNPVLGSVSGHDDRDPQVFWHEDSQKWVQAVWVAAHDGKPQSISFFGSPNLKDWSYLSETPNFFECPDFFELPVDGNPNDTRWVLYGADGKYQLGDFDGTQFAAQAPASGKYTQDYGAHFYAAQTWHDVPASDGRRLQVAWMNGASYPGMPFNQQMSFPVELTLRTTSDGVRMFREPVEEIAELHEGGYLLSNVTLRPGEDPLGSLTGDLFHIEAEIELGGASSVGFSIRGNQVRYDVGSQTLSALGRSALLPPVNGRINLELLVDRSSLEVFGGHGLVSMTTGFTPSASNQAIDLFATGGNARVVSLSAFQLASSWPDTQPDPSNGLIGHWRFDDPTNAAGFVDDAGSDFKLANSGLVAHVPGVAGTAADLNNSNDYAFVPDSSAMNADSFTLSMWVHPDSVGQKTHVVGKTEAQQGSWGVEQLADGRFNFFVLAENGVLDSVQTSDSLGPASWYHTVAAYDSQLGRLELYVNGEFAGSTEGTISGPPKFDTSPLMLGQRRVGFGGTLGAMNGQIDDMQLYGSVLSPGQIGFLYNNPGIAIDPVAFELGSLVLTIDIETGETTIINSDANLVQLKGYSIISNSGALSLAGWQSLQKNPNPAYAGWEEANPTAFSLNELNPGGSLTIMTSTQVGLGSPVAPFEAPAFGTAVRNTDLGFEYTTADGQVLHGQVEMTGVLAVNNLLLTVDPATGQGQLQNRSLTTIRLQGYSILSGSGSLNPSNGDWNSLADQGIAGVDEANASTSNLSELIPFIANSLILTPGQTYQLGGLFDTSGMRDLTLEFLIAASTVEGDFNQDGIVNGADLSVWQAGFGATYDGSDFLTWQRNIGATGFVSSLVMDGVVKYQSLPGAIVESVPEPNSLWLALILFGVVKASDGRKRRANLP